MRHLLSVAKWSLDRRQLGILKLEEIQGWNVYYCVWSACLFANQWYRTIRHAVVKFGNRFTELFLFAWYKTEQGSSSWCSPVRAPSGLNHKTASTQSAPGAKPTLEGTNHVTSCASQLSPGSARARRRGRELKVSSRTSSKGGSESWRNRQIGGSYSGPVLHDIPFLEPKHFSLVQRTIMLEKRKKQTKKKSNQHQTFCGLLLEKSHNIQASSTMPKFKVALIKHGRVQKGAPAWMLQAGSGPSKQVSWKKAAVKSKAQNKRRIKSMEMLITCLGITYIRLTKSCIKGGSSPSKKVSK